MTGDQLLQKLKRMSKKRRQEKVLIMVVEDGITFAQDIFDCHAAEPHDGKHIWILPEDDLIPPAWVLT